MNVSVFNEINRLINKHDNIVITKHIGPDMDALGSSFALKNSILKAFPNKTCLVVGKSSSRYKTPKCDKEKELNDPLLIVLDTPNIARIDIKDLSKYNTIIKIDHHPFMEKFIGSSVEYIDEDASSTSEIITRFLLAYNYPINKEIATLLFRGIITDTNRFLYNFTPLTMKLASNLIDKHNLDTKAIYDELYLRPLSELKVREYIISNINLSPNGLAYIIISNDALEKLHTDPNIPGNFINELNTVSDVYVWAIATEDIKNKIYKVNVRSRGPSINTVCEKYYGGGHALASGARIPIDELDKVKSLFKDLDNSIIEYKKDSYEN